MLKNFENWLLENKYKPTTALDYSLRIDRICRKQKYTLEHLCNNINDILPLYMKGGKRANIGNRSHSSYRQALKQFNLFLMSLKPVDE